MLGGSEAAENVEDWSRDGKYLIYNFGSGSHAVLRVLPLAGDRKPVTYLDTRFATSESQFSPNGRWVAYYSTESGKPEVYVQGFNRWTRRSRAANGRSRRRAASCRDGAATAKSYTTA